MISGNNGSYEYLKSAVMTATPEQLQLMLLDGAIRFATRGREAIEKKDIEGAFHALERAQRIVLELISGMNRDVNPPLVEQMAGLYNFIYRRLVEAGMKRDTVPIDEALRILSHQRDTWQLLIEKVKRELAPSAPRPTSALEAHEPALSVEG